MGKSIPQMVFDRFFGAAIQEKVKAGIDQYKNMQAASVRDEDKGWVKLTEDGTRDLTPINKDRELEIAFTLWRANPICHFMIETMVSFICGDGFAIQAKNDDVKKLCTEFWKHPLNDLDTYFENHVRERLIFGDLTLPKFIGKFTGRVAVSYIDPRDIKRVVADPKNAKIKIAVIVKGKDFQDGKKYRIVLHPDIEEYLSPEAQTIRESCGESECYYSMINALTNETRGTGEPYVVADWCDGYENFLFDYADRWPQLNMVVWDMMVKGGTEKTIGDQVKNFTKKSGDIFAHNENVTLEAKTPDIKSIEAKEGAGLFRNHILGAKNIPEVYFGGGGDANRASSAEMGTPFFRSMSKKQKQAISLGNFILADVIREADERGMLPEVKDDEKTAELIAPEMVAKDNSKFATAIQQMATALMQMKAEGWIDQDNAGKVAAFMLAWIGYEFDYDLIKDKIEKDKLEQDYRKDKAPELPKEPGENRREPAEGQV